MRAIAAAGVLVLVLCGTTRAQMLGEVRGGIFAHDLGGVSADPPLSPGRLQDANLEFLFLPLVDAGPLGSLHPDIGATANFGGKQSYAYAGVNWHVPVMLTPFFAEAGLAGALGSAVLDQPTPDPLHPLAAVNEARQLGCAVQLHAQVSVGLDITPLADVMLTAEHYRPLQDCGTDAPVTNAGIRVGFRF